MTPIGKGKEAGLGKRKMLSFSVVKTKAVYCPPHKELSGWGDPSESEQETWALNPITDQLVAGCPSKGA